jgi:photosystem II stability/assembly factor-like uncharacterized protein
LIPTLEIKWYWTRLAVFLFLFIIPMRSHSQWVQTKGPYGGSVLTFAVSDTTLYAGTHAGIFRSTDNGATWIDATSGVGITDVNTLVLRGPECFAGTNGSGIYLSKDNGVSWKAINNGLTGSPCSVASIAFAGNYIYAGTYPGGLFRSSDDGEHWTVVKTNFSWWNPVYQISQIVVKDTMIFIETGGTYYQSNLNGDEWIPVPTGMTNEKIRYLAQSGSTLYGSTANGISRSYDNGVSWTGIGNFGANSPITISGSNLFVASWDPSIYVYNINTNSWTQITFPPTTSGIGTLCVAGSSLFVGSGRDILRSTDMGAHWDTVNNGLTNTNITSLLVSGTTIFAGTYNEGLFTSANSGESWIRSDAGLPISEVNFLKENGTTLYAGTSSGLYRSTDNGRTWTDANSGMGLRNVKCLAIAGTTMFAGTEDWSSQAGGIFRSLDNGATWTRTFNGEQSNGVRGILTWGSTILAGTIGGILRSTDNGSTWSLVTNGQACWGQLFESGNVTYSTTPGLFRSTDRGEHWTSITTPWQYNSMVKVLTVAEGKLIAGIHGDADGVFISTNNGSTWDKIYWPTSYATSFALSGQNIFAGTYQNSVWKNTVSALITDVPLQSEDMPHSFSLEQNYPNPFNPSTVIRFNIPLRSYVTLTIYDMLGRSVATLISGDLPEGEHSHTWNAAAYPSGMYFCQLRAGTFTEIRKLVLAK